MTGYIDGHCGFNTFPQPKLASPCYTRRDLQSLPAHMPHDVWALRVRHDMCGGKRLVMAHNVARRAGDAGAGVGHPGV
jgi:hypothetical protein